MKSYRMDGTVQTVERLEDCVSHLISLPDLWSLDTLPILESLLDALIRMLGLEFASIKLGAVIKGAPCEVTRLAGPIHQTFQVQEVHHVIDRCLAAALPASPLVVSNPMGEGEVSVISCRLGLLGDIGVLVAGAQRADFPSRNEMLLLRVATNQAAMGLQEAHRVNAQRRSQEEQERVVGERTAQMTAVSATLKKEIIERNQAEAALRHSEERFRRYFDLGLVGMAITSPVKGCLEVNDELCRILGYERRELLQKTWAEFTHPDDLAADAAQFTRVMAGEMDGYSLDKRWIRKDGRVIDSIMAAKCVRRADGSVEYFVGLIQDITERKRAEDEVRTLKDQLATDLLAMTRLHEFSTRLLGSTELMPILDELLNATRGLHHADFGCIQLYEPNTRSLKVVAQQGVGEGVLDYFRIVQEDRAACGQALHGLERVIIEDVETDWGFEPHRTIAATAGFRAVQSTALCSRSGRLLGMISTYFRDPHRPSERELTLTDLYARQAADMIERKQAEKALKDSEERFRLAIEGVKGYAVYMLDAEGRVVTWNKGAEHATGYRSEDVLGTYHARFFQLNESESLKAEQGLKAAASTGRFEDEGWQVRKNGSQFWANVVITGLRDDNGELQGFLKVTRDMTEPHQARVALEMAYQEVKELKDKLANEKRYLEGEIRSERGFEEIIGQSRPLRAVLRQIEKVAPTDTTVLIQGETGTGKELIARALHNLSKRRDKTFVKVNCAAIPTGLLESELFGHERGAFTGAISQKLGRFELAHQGTIFLDEVGEIPLELQVKLLRVLQEHEFERLGSTRTQRVDIRVLAATNRDLAQMVVEKTFRSDLYYRLYVFPVTVPALHERTEDIPSLVQYFTKKYARQLNRPIGHIPEDTMNALCRYAWPGNIRELENVIERCVILSAEDGLELDGPLLREVHADPPSLPHAATLEDAERDYIRRALTECRWIISGPFGAAHKLGLKRSTLQYKMQKLGILRPLGDSGPQG